MDMRRVVGRVAMAIGLLAVGTATIACSRPADQRLDDVRFAVLQQQVRYWLDEPARANGTVLCVAIEGDGARVTVTKPYLQRLAHAEALRPRHDCEERASGAVERSTGRPAVLVTVGKVEWKSPNEAWVTTRHYRSALASGERIQRVVREDTRWVCLGQIIKDTPL